MNDRHAALLQLPSACLLFSCHTQDKGAQQHGSVPAVPVVAPGLTKGLCIFSPVAIPRDLHRQ